jgi:TrpR family transcriptional regulator, trp operon repressor
MQAESDHEAALRELAGVLADMRDRQEVYETLYALLTPPERDKIASRWRLVCLLEKGMTQRAIAAELGISLCKITRGSHELKHGPRGFRKAIRKAVGGER